MDTHGEDIIAFQAGQLPTVSVQPTYVIGRTSQAGFTVSDSSMRRLVDSSEPSLHRIPVRGEGQASTHRDVWVYAIPGCAILPGATDWGVSTWHVFWKHQGGLLSRAKFFVVPQRHSVVGEWGSNTRHRLYTSVIEATGGQVITLPTVRETYDILGGTEAEVFGEDSVHMTPVWTRRIHDKYWQRIEEIMQQEKLHDSVPILIWDFNASSQHLKDDWQQHVEFWKLITKWGQTNWEEPLVKDTIRGKINSMIYRNKKPCPTWFKTSRAKNQDTKCKLQDGDEPRTTERADISRDAQDRWCPGWSEGWDTATHPTIFASRTTTATLALRGGWPKGDDVETWKKILKALCRAHGGPIESWQHPNRLVAQATLGSWANLLILGGNFERELFAAVARDAGMTDEDMNQMVQSNLNVWTEL